MNKWLKYISWFLFHDAAISEIESRLQISLWQLFHRVSVRPIFGAYLRVQLLKYVGIF